MPKPAALEARVAPVERRAEALAPNQALLRARDNRAALKRALMTLLPVNPPPHPVAQVQAPRLMQAPEPAI
jgi:hypothetical protein